MKRPLDTYPPLKAAYHQALQQQLATRWYQNPLRVLKIGLRKAAQLPAHCHQAHCDHPLLVTADLQQALRLVGLKPGMGRLETEMPLYIPAQAPVIDPSLHFAQFAAVWEPILPDYPVPVKLHNSLICEMGAGFYLLSLHFAPHQNTSGSAALQLDQMSIRQGHEVYHLPVHHSDDATANQINRARIEEVLMISRKFVNRVNYAYTRAERILEQGLMALIADMRAISGHHPVGGPADSPAHPPTNSPVNSPVNSSAPHADTPAALPGVKTHKPEWL